MNYPQTAWLPVAHVYYLIVSMSQNSRYNISGFLYVGTFPKAVWSSENSAKGGPVFKFIYRVVAGKFRIRNGYCAEEPVPCLLVLSIKQHAVWQLA